MGLANRTVMGSSTSICGRREHRGAARGLSADHCTRIDSHTDRFMGRRQWAGGMGGSP